MRDRLRGFTEPRRLSIGIAAVHLAALSAFAVAKPFLDLLTAGTLLEWNYRPIDVAVVAVGILLLPPLLLLALELMAGAFGWRTRYWLHLILVVALVYLIAAYAFRTELPDDGKRFPVFSVSLAIGLLAAATYHRFARVRSFVSVTAIAVPLFLTLFLFTSSASKVLLPTDVSPTRASVAPTPVVMVVFDEFPISSLMTRNEQIAASRYPNFAALARTSTWYRNATTVHDFTRWAVPAIVTGRYSKHPSSVVASDHRESVFKLLGRTHKLDVFEGGTRLCPANLCDQRARGTFPGRIPPLLGEAGLVYLNAVLPSRLSRELPPKRLLPVERPGHDVEEFTDSLAKRTAKPRFAFLHVLAPHAPFTHLPSGRRYIDPRGLAPEALDPEATSANRILSDLFLRRHLAQVAYTDRLLGRILVALRRNGELDRSLVVVTADHGMSFRPGVFGFGHRVAFPPTIQDILGIPLFVKAPGQRVGRIDDSYARTIDIAPTIAALLHAKLPWRVDGSALDPHRSLPAMLTINPPFRFHPSIASGRFVRLRKAQAARVAGFGTGPADPGLFRWGPRPDLDGKPSQRLAVQPRPALSVHLDNPGAFGSVDLGGEVPAMVTGSVDGRGARGVRSVAVAVNGRVAATAWTYIDRKRVRFAAFTGDRWLHPGRNEVTIVALPVARGAGARAQATTLTPPG